MNRKQRLEVDGIALLFRLKGHFQRRDTHAVERADEQRPARAAPAMQGMYRAFAEEVIGMLATPELHNGIANDLAFYPLKRSGLPPLIRLVIIGNHKHIMFRPKLRPGKPRLKVLLAQRLSAIHPRRRPLNMGK